METATAKQSDQGSETAPAGRHGGWWVSVAALVAANLVPLFGVVVWRWEVFPLLLLFWLENVLVGLFNVLKLLMAAPAEPMPWAGKLFLIPFFTVHYGMFTLVHGVFVMGLFGGAFRAGAPPPDIGMIWRAVGEHKLQWAVAGLALSHGVSFACNYIGRGEYRRATLSGLMAQPYGRVVVLHLALLLGGFVLMALRSPLGGLVLLVLLKIALDVRAHLRERRRYSGGPMNEKPLPGGAGGF